MSKILIMKRSERPAIVRLFQKGLPMQVPKGSMTKAEIEEVLAASTTLIYSETDAIGGFVSFTRTHNGLRIEFIFSDKRRKGIGTMLMRRAARHAKRLGLAYVSSEVSVMDKRASGFYDSLGFTKQKKINYFLYRIRATPRSIMAKSHSTV
ncbi:MAG: GNAT family N-acetyltransferase [Candidatus Marsarchaeota archaeon]|jgi:GNAT superfamily N-acetyltransferase|nr:GNAT family N-acetyltransferase [Candidatus Marsarchaeota archaeon]